MALTATAIALGVTLSAWWFDKSTTTLGHGGSRSATEWCSDRLRERFFPRARVETDESQNVTERLEAALPDAANSTLDSNWGGSETSVRSTKVPNYVRFIAGEIKLRYPYATLEMSTADLLSVQAAIRECFKRDKLRVCDQIRYMGLITTMVFTPSQEEVRDQRDLQSRARYDQISQFNAGTRDHWLDSLFGNERRARFTRH